MTINIKKIVLKGTKTSRGAKSTYTAKQKLKIFAEWDGGAKVADLSRHYQISPATLYKWRKEAWECSFPTGCDHDIVEKSLS